MLAPELPRRSGAVTRPVKPELTVPEAAALVRKSTHAVYRWIRQERLAAEDTTDGLIVQTADVLRVAASARPGRPRGD